MLNSFYFVIIAWVFSTLYITVEGKFFVIDNPYLIADKDGDLKITLDCLVDDIASYSKEIYSITIDRHPFSGGQYDEIAKADKDVNKGVAQLTDNKLRARTTVTGKVGKVADSKMKVVMRKMVCEDAGTYRCTIDHKDASNERKRPHRELNITVTSIPEDIRLVVEPKKKNDIYEIGDNIILECSAKAGNLNLQQPWTWKWTDKDENEDIVWKIYPFATQVTDTSTRQSVCESTIKTTLKHTITISDRNRIFTCMVDSRIYYSKKFTIHSLCHTNFYGPDCKSVCSRRQCKKTTECDNFRGKCVGGCLPGWKGFACDAVCDKKHYGENCAKKCDDRNCDQDTSCEPQHGRCNSGCLGNWKGPDCTNIDGSWSSWKTSTGKCNTDCKRSVIMLRTCSNPPPGGSGMKCIGNATSITKETCTGDQCTPLTASKQTSSDDTTVIAVSAVVVIILVVLFVAGFMYVRLQKKKGVVVTERLHKMLSRKSFLPPKQHKQADDTIGGETKEGDKLGDNIPADVTENTDAIQQDDKHEHEHKHKHHTDEEHADDTTHEHAHKHKHHTDEEHADDATHEHAHKHKHHTDDENADDKHKHQHRKTTIVLGDDNDTTKHAQIIVEEGEGTMQINI